MVEAPYYVTQVLKYEIIFLYMCREDEIRG